MRQLVHHELRAMDANLPLITPRQSARLPGGVSRICTHRPSAKVCEYCGASVARAWRLARTCAIEVEVAL